MKMTNKTIKTWSKFAVAAAMVVPAAVVVQATPSFAEMGEVTIDGIVYSYDDTNLAIGATIVDYTGTATEVNIPETITVGSSQIAVTTIGVNAFHINQLTSVAIPTSVTTIDDYAFANNQLTNVTIPTSVTTIDAGAFAYNQLTSVTIPTSVTKIRAGAFSDNQLTNVTIPTSVTAIGAMAFAYNQLTSVTIPTSVTTIGDYVFVYNQLTSATIPSSLTSIGTEAFSNNPGLTLRGLSTILSKDTSIGVAKEATDYKLVYDGNDATSGTAPTDEKIYDYQDHATIVLEAGTLEKTGYTFAGWSLSPEANSEVMTSYTFDKLDPANTTYTLYAQWKSSTDEETSPTTNDTAIIRIKGNGSIAVLVNGDDKATVVNDDVTGQPLTVTIMDVNGSIVTKSERVTEGKYTSPTDLAPGNYTVTISNGKVSQMTLVTVKESKTPKATPANFVWESASSGIKDAKSKITKTGAIAGVVYTDTTETTIASDTTIQVISANGKTTWETPTNDKGIFKVFVPKGKYNVVVVGKETEAKADLLKNTFQEGITVAAGSVAMPMDTLHASELWGATKESHFNFKLDTASLTTNQLKSTAVAGSTVAVYLVNNKGVKIFLAEAKTSAKGAYTIKLPHALAGEKVLFSNVDKAGNVWEETVEIAKATTMPILNATTKAGVASKSTKVTATATKNTANQLYVFKGNSAPSTVAGDHLPVGSIALPTSDIDMTDATHLTVYEVSPTGKIVKAKTLTGKELKLAK